MFLSVNGYARAPTIYLAYNAEPSLFHMYCKT